MKHIKAAPVRLGHGVEVSFSLIGGQMACEWSPDVPRGDLADRIMPAYLIARGRFLERVSETLGIKILCVDAGGAS